MHGFRYFLVVFLLSYLAVELTLRIVFGNLAIIHLVDYRADEFPSVFLRPNASVDYTGHWYRYASVEHAVNSAGYRGALRAKEKPPETFRVLTLGDSMTYGVGVGEGHAIADYLETALERRSARNIEVLNFGVPGYNFDEVVEYYSHYLTEWEHDLVLYFMYHNDLETPVSTLYHHAYDNRRFLSVALQHSYSLRIPYFLWRRRTRDIIIDRIPENGLPAVLDTMLEGLDTIKQSASERRAGVGVVVLGNPLRGKFTARLFDALSKSETPFQDLTEVLLDQRNIAPKDGHFSEVGNQRVGEKTATWIFEQGLIGETISNKEL